jgi:hypothetical protein
MIKTVEGERPEDLLGLQFRDFIAACSSGELSTERLTFDQWKRKKFRETLQPEYDKYILDDLDQARGDYTKLHHGGNFYDWMAEVKGLTLTSDESEIRLHQQEA